MPVKAEKALKYCTCTQGPCSCALMTKCNLFVKLPLVTVLKDWTCSDFHISLLPHTKNHETIHVITMTVINAHAAQVALNSVTVQENVIMFLSDMV